MDIRWFWCSRKRQILVMFLYGVIITNVVLSFRCLFKQLHFNFNYIYFKFSLYEGQWFVHHIDCIWSEYIWCLLQYKKNNNVGNSDLNFFLISTNLLNVFFKLDAMKKQFVPRTEWIYLIFGLRKAKIERTIWSVL